MLYDYLIVGSGLFGSVFARTVKAAGKKVLLIESRKEVGGNVCTGTVEGIQTHLFGPHVFHTSDENIWNYVNRFANFNNYQHMPKATYKGKVYSLPFNMNTFNQLWGVVTPEEAKAEIARQRIKIENPANMEEFVLSEVGPDLYEKLIHGYSKKQWKRSPKELPASIIKRLPLRFTYDDNYFDDKYQGIPLDGYSKMVENMVDGIDVKTDSDFFDIKDWRTIAKKLVYSGKIDQLFNYEFGDLEYRTLEFEQKVVDGDFQGVSIMNYTEESVPYTRITEHKHFLKQSSPKSVITYEYPTEWSREKIPYYPVNDAKNNALYEKYKAKADAIDGLIVGGRLGKFKYLDMAPVIAMALMMARKELGTEVNEH